MDKPIFIGNRMLVINYLPSYDYCVLHITTLQVVCHGTVTPYFSFLSDLQQEKRADAGVFLERREFVGCFLPTKIDSNTWSGIFCTCQEY